MKLNTHVTIVSREDVDLTGDGALDKVKLDNAEVNYILVKMVIDLDEIEAIREAVHEDESIDPTLSFVYTKAGFMYIVHTPFEELVRLWAEPSSLTNYLRSAD